MANTIINKLLQKNIQLSYRLLNVLDSNHVKKDSVYRLELKRFLGSFANALSGKRVLDIGSGSWSWTKETFSPMCNFISFDIVSHKNVDVVGDLYHLQESFPQEIPFDIVIATDVFEHLACPIDVLKQISSLLTPSGLFLASTPFKKISMEKSMGTIGVLPDKDGRFCWRQLNWKFHRSPGWVKSIFP